MSAWRILVLLLLSLALGACSARTGGRDVAESPDRNGLPGLNGLDSLRSLSSGGSLSLDPQQSLDSANAAPSGNGLDLTALADAMAWAVYRIDPASLPQPDAVPVNIQLSGSGNLNLLLADFAAQRWTFAAALSSGQAGGDFSALVQPLSAEGFAYFAVVVPAGSSGHIDGLELSYNTPQNTFYVAPPQQGGDDANDGTFESPWATLQFAADQAGPGTLIIVRPGSFEAFSIRHGGTADAPVIFRAEPGVVISTPQAELNAGIEISRAAELAEYVHVEGFEILSVADFGITVNNVQDPRRGIVLRANHCSGTGSAGIWLLGTVGALVEDNHCQDSLQSGITIGGDCQGLVLRGNVCEGNDESGISFNGNNGPVEDETKGILIEGNVCFSNGINDPGSAALLVRNLHQSVIRNNLLYRNGQGILVDGAGDGGATGNFFVNNTVFQDEDGGACIRITTNASGNLLFNNILLHDTNGAPALEIDNSSLSGFQSDYNIFSNKIVTEEQGNLTLAQWQALGKRDGHSRLGNSFNLFVATVEDNYRLAAGALALESALADFSPQSDLDGISRPQGDNPDIGCYEKAGP